MSGSDREVGLVDSGQVEYLGFSCSFRTLPTSTKYHFFSILKPKSISKAKPIIITFISVKISCLIAAMEC